MSQVSYSQDGVQQDLWVYKLFIEQKHQHAGGFLDVGACHPTALSNTFLLESLGWRGLLIDQDPNCEAAFKAQRVSPFLLADARAVDWPAALREHHLGMPVEYLSLDCDECTLDVAGRLFSAVRFQVATVEHDAYRFGDGPRAAMRDMLDKLGYELVASNVCGSRSKDWPFEDWFVDPALVEPRRAREVVDALGVVYDKQP